MANSRYINTNFWRDNYVIDLDPSEKLLFMYFLTNPNTNIAGVYEINLRQVAFDTGFDIEMIKKILDRFARDGKIFYKEGWVILKNFVKHQRVNPSVKSGIQRVLNNLPVWLDIELVEENNRGHLSYTLQLGDRLYTDSDILIPNLNLTLPIPNAAEADAGEKGKNLVPKVSTKEIDQLFEYWEQVVGYAVTSDKKRQREFASKLIKENKLADIEKMIQGVSLATQDQFAPRISNFRQLYYKWDDLKAWGRRTMSKQSGAGKVAKI